MSDPRFDPLGRTDGRYADSPYSDRRAEGAGPVGVVVALIAAALLIGGLFFYSGGSGPQVATSPPSGQDTMTGSRTAPPPAQRAPSMQDRAPQQATPQ
jgi:hypothetical protein